MLRILSIWLKGRGTSDGLNPVSLIGAPSSLLTPRVWYLQKLLPSCLQNFRILVTLRMVKRRVLNCLGRLARKMLLPCLGHACRIRRGKAQLKLFNET